VLVVASTSRLSRQQLYFILLDPTSACETTPKSPTGSRVTIIRNRI
jgi:hypothetical protein